LNEFLEYHRGLLADETRTRTYREAIRAVVKPGDVVLDLGSGSGILSFFACEAGAARVYAIDHSHMADVASFLSRHLGFSDRITVLHAESSRVKLPELADVLVTETMGVSGFDEGILAHVLDARARLLRPEAAIVPRRLALGVAPVDIADDYQTLVGWWSQPHYGLDLAPLRVFASNVMHLVHIDTSAHLAQGADVIAVDLAAFDSRVVHGRTTYLAERPGTLHGFATWFTASLAPNLSIDNRERKSSHWSQGFLPLERPIPLKRGARIELEVETDDGTMWRWRGSAAGTPFDQITWFGMPPCDLAGLRIEN
jgi:enediyne biosynthesis protein CalE3